MLRGWKWGIALLFTVFLLSEGQAFGEIKTKWGTYFRLRHELWYNNFDLATKASTNDNRNFFRYKSSIWGQVDFSDQISLYGKLTNEFRTYLYYFQSTSKKKGVRGDINEFFMDQLYVDLKKVADLPLDIRFGRQDLLGQYGESFLIGDGTPGDGSRSFYFNAIKMAYKIDDNNSLDFLYILDPRDDVFLPVLNEDKSPQNLNITKEQGFVLYWKNKNLIKNTYLEGYYIHKIEDDEYGVGPQGAKSRLNTYGAYARWTSDPWTVRGQLALQEGDYGANDRTGIGAYVYVDRKFKNMLMPVATVGYLYLSGDNPDTSKNEGFNPLFSRFPWISDLYGFTIAKSGDQTGALCYWSNLSMLRAQLRIKPTSKSMLTSSYSLLMAPELVPVASRTDPFDSGKTRGQLYITKFDYTFNKNVSAYIQMEYFIPGSFYESNQDTALFLRTQLEMKF